MEVGTNLPPALTFSRPHDVSLGYDFFSELTEKLLVHVNWSRLDQPCEYGSISNVSETMSIYPDDEGREIVTKYFHD